MHGWNRERHYLSSPVKRILLGITCSCLVLMVIVAAFHLSIGAALPAHPAVSVSLPGWAPAAWNEKSVSDWMQLLPRQHTFAETLLAFPLLLGWWVHYHQTWGLPLLFCGALLILGIWHFVAHVLGNRKPSVLFSALIMLQVTAFGWGLTFYAPLPYYPRTSLAVIDFKSTFPGILTTSQKADWYVKSGYTGFSVSGLQNIKKSAHGKYNNLLIVDNKTAGSYAAQLSPRADWWLFPKDTSTETALSKAWKAGKCAAVSLKNPPASSWEMLPPASRINVFLSAIALLSFAFLYGIQPAAADASAPSRIMNFLQKRRRPKRWGGLAMMLLACLGTALALWLTFYPAWGFVRLETLSLGATALLWIALDFAYWQGRKSWKRKH